MHTIAAAAFLLHVIVLSPKDLELNRHFNALLNIDFRNLMCEPSLLRHAKGGLPHHSHPTTPKTQGTACFRLCLYCV